MSDAVMGDYLDIARCPHCGTCRPSLQERANETTRDHLGGNERYWGVFLCSFCGGLVTAWARPGELVAQEIYPKPRAVDETVPKRARDYLTQAMESPPAGAVILAASSIDAMLKAEGYKEGSLNARIDKAAGEHLITSEMAAWAHEVRLDANDQRHADDETPLPTDEEAKRVIDFAEALGQFLFVLPARVRRGRKGGTSPKA